MATVYLAQDGRHGRKVALKVLRPELSGVLGADRFAREIAIAARLTHPHILPIYDSGAAELGPGTPVLYYTMPYVAGKSLRDRLREEPQLPVDEAVGIARQVADALDHAHRQGIIHRDIKPENILLADGHAVVADFGIARALDAAGGERLTETGLALGTPAYMSPEQGAASTRLDGRADIYALGCVLYEMLAGQPPFTGPTVQAILARHAIDPVPSLRTVRSAVGPGLSRVVVRALAKVPADRFPTARAFSNALTGPEMTWTHQEPTVPVPTRPASWRRRAVAAAALALAATLATVLVVTVLPGNGQRVKVDPAVVAVAPFRVAAADPSLGYLREGMVDLLSARLSGEQGLRSADAASVLRAWGRAAGSGGTEMTQEAALEIGRGLGAGRVIDGSVVGTPGRLTLTASLLTAPGGRRATRASVEGPVDSLSTLVDRLAAALLTLDAGVAVSRLSSTSASLPAVRAFLAGREAFRQGRPDEAFRQYREATMLDSTFALAALELVHASVWVGGAWSEDAQRAKRLAQAGRNRLSPGDRTLLDAWDVVDPTGPEWLGKWQAAANAYPDRAETWYELGDAYYHNGGLVGLDDPLRLAGAAFQRGWAIDSANGADSVAPGHPRVLAEPLVHMVEIAQTTGDTAAVRRFVGFGLAADSTRGSYLRWHGALALGDSALRAFWADSQDVEPGASSFIAQFMNWTGLGTRDLARATRLDIRDEETGHPGAVSSAHALAILNGGQPREALRVLHGSGTSDDFIGRLNDALYWGGDTTAAADAARRLAPLAAAAARPGEEGLPHIRALCALGAWHAAHGDYAYAEMAIRGLRAAGQVWLSTTDTVPPNESVAVCSALLAATRATALHLPDAQTRLAQADVAARTYILSHSLAANLVVARVAEAQGDLALALRALRRRASGPGQFPWYLSTFLREEGRLAALTGDTAGAIHAYQHYLALRPDPEPEMKPDVVQVRAELAKLLQEPRQ
jgi:TolB-like protein